MPDAIPQTLAALTVPIDSVRPYARNPRRGSTAVIRESLDLLADLDAELRESP